MPIRVALSKPFRFPHQLLAEWHAAALTHRNPGSVAANLDRLASSGAFEHQRRSFDRVLSGKSVFLTAGTSSGKTYAVALPLLHRLANRQIRRVCFMYPTRALLEGQRIDVGDLAELRDITTGTATGGRTVSELMDAMASRVVFATPDELYWYFAKTTKHAGALAWSLTQIDDFVFDEIHVFRSYTLDNLVWFIQRLRVLNPAARFHFLSATTAPELYDRLHPFGDFGEPIRGESFTGQIEVDFANWGPVTWRHRERVLEYLSDPQAKHVVAIFNSARFVHRFRMEYGAGPREALLLANTGKRLFHYTGYMDKRDRDHVIAEFQQVGGVLLTTSAAEVGVDFDCDHLLMEEFGAESTVQRFGRAGRSGEAAHVLIVGTAGLESRVMDRLPSSEVSREQFITALSDALGGFQYLASTSEFAAYSHFCVNLGLGATGLALNERMFNAEDRARFGTWATDRSISRYGLRSIMPQVRLANGVGAEPAYILQLAPRGSLYPTDDSRFEIVKVDRTYDGLVWQPFDFEVSVDENKTFSRGYLVDVDAGSISIWDGYPLWAFWELSPRGASRGRFRQPEAPILHVQGVRVGLCFGDVVLRRVTRGEKLPNEPELAVRGWYYLLLSSEDAAALNALVWRLTYLENGEAGNSPVSTTESADFSFNRGAMADLEVLRAEGPPPYAFILERAFGACYEIWKELREQINH